jgi:hypothetical protein
MSRAPSTFRQRDVTAAFKAAKAAGVDVARVEVAKDGRIVIVVGSPGDSTSGDSNPWDEVLTHASDEKRPS